MKKTMKQFSVVRQLNIMGIITISMMGVLIGLEIFDYRFLTDFERQFFSPSEQILFNHLQRLLIIGIFFLISYAQYFYTLKKFPALKHKTNSIIHYALRILVVTFILVVGIRIYGTLTLDFPYTEHENFRSFANQQSVPLVRASDPRDSNNSIDDIVISNNLRSLLGTAQAEENTEFIYCLYGEKLVPANAYRDVIIDHTIIVEGALRANDVIASEREIMAEPCPEEINPQSLTYQTRIDYDDSDSELSNGPLALVGILHSHPQTVPNNYFKLHPQECTLSNQDIFSFARENLAGRAWIWGVICSNEKFYFYGADNVKIPIELHVIK